MVCRKWLPAVLMAGGCLGAMTLGHRAAAATLTPVPPTVIAGNSVTLTLDDTFPQLSGVAVMDLKITFDPALLSLTSIVEGKLLTDADWDPAVFKPATGVVSIQEDAYVGSDLEGTGSVLLVTFTALASDLTGITSINLQTQPGLDTPAAAAQGEYQLASTSATINITAAPVVPPTTVPEPGTIALLLVPMLSAACLKRRDRC